MDRVSDILGTNGHPPWDESLLAQLRAAEARLELARREYAALRIENNKLRATIRSQRHSLDLWQERYRAGRVK